VPYRNGLKLQLCRRLRCALLTAIAIRALLRPRRRPAGGGSQQLGQQAAVARARIPILGSRSSCYSCRKGAVPNLNPYKGGVTFAGVGLIKLSCNGT
jgi:hypothetical protein